jgi:TP901 family phage tail tape measure protein|nr:MAG TPA_asm: tail tape measure protein [Caudoviricetes sp.]
MPADLVTRILLKNDQFDRNIKKSKAQIKSFEKTAKAVSVGMRSFVGSFAAMAGVSVAFTDAIKTSMQFEKSLSSLRSITGLSATDMEFFKQKAIELGSTSTQTASQVVEAFQLIGSQQPELLKNKEALSEVTKQAITLAEAAGMDVPEAAKALSGSINQMGESADKAGEYVNILAAASQAGSADIQYLSKAIEKSGGAASSVGVKYNELVAAIEAIAPKISEASEAGTNLRNIFLTLEASTDKNLKPSVVGLTAALDNLAKKNLDATGMTKMFGKESVTAALAIVNAKDQYKEYVKAITGTNTAIEQQKRNNDNLAGSINGLSSAWKGFILTLNKSNGTLKETFDSLSKMVMQATELLKSDQQKQNEIISEGVTYRKKQLEKEIEGWMVLGDRRSAINETMRQFNKRNDDPIVSEKEFRSAMDRLGQLKKALAEINDKQKTKNAGDLLVKHLTGLPNLGTSYADINLKKKLEKEIEAQQEIVYKLEAKNVLYKESVKYLNEQLVLLDKAKEEEKDIKVGGSSGNVEIPIQLGSEKDLSNKILKLKERISNEVNPEIRFDLLREQDKLQKQLDKIRKENKLVIDLVLNAKPMEAPGLSAGDTEGKNPIGDVAILNDEMQQKKIKNINEEAEAYYKYRSELQETSVAISSIGSAFQSLGGLMGESASDWMNWAGNMTNAISSVLPVMRQLVDGNSAVAISGSAASAASTPFIGWIQAVSAVATMVGLMANLPKFEQGGIVPGGMYTGDKVLARVNSGEMILNKSQQNNLYNAINKGNREETIHITGKLVGSGSNLVAVVDNYARKQGRMR